MQWFAILILSILSCVVYGVLHDLVTTRICVEYFTIGHPRLIESQDPTLLALGWGVIATWWVGAILGVPLATIARIGQRPKLTAQSLVRPLSIVLAINGMFATFAGIVGYFAAKNGWVWLIGPLAERVPPEKHTAFLVDLWAHNGSYLGGFIGGILLMIWVWRSRGREDISRNKPRA